MVDQIELLCDYDHPWFICKSDKSIESQKKCPYFVMSQRSLRCQYFENTGNGFYHCKAPEAHKKYSNNHK